jgi:hypothetical protein
MRISHSVQTEGAGCYFCQCAQLFSCVVLAYGSRENWSSFSRWRAFHAPLFRVTVSYDLVFPRQIHFSFEKMDGTMEQAM